MNHEEIRDTPPFHLLGNRLTMKNADKAQNADA